MIAYNNKNHREQIENTEEVKESIYLSLNSNYIIDYLDFFVDFEQEIKMQEDLDYLVF